MLLLLVVLLLRLAAASLHLHADQFLTPPCPAAFGASPFGGGSTFGASQPAFGATSTPAFGASSAPAFGQQNLTAFGSTTFGQAAPAGAGGGPGCAFPCCCRSSICSKQDSGCMAAAMEKVWNATPYLLPPAHMVAPCRRLWRRVWRWGAGHAGGCVPQDPGAGHQRQQRQQDRFVGPGGANGQLSSSILTYMCHRAAPACTKRLHAGHLLTHPPVLLPRAAVVYFNSISCMPEYAGKSVDELRFEDYSVRGGLKGWLGDRGGWARQLAEQEAWLGDSGVAARQLAGRRRGQRAGA